tara:strand:+ start:505 stop:2412 length:1908 start_codon:yes stop_codon:yes gene_type:complete
MSFHFPTLLSYNHTKEWIDDTSGFNFRNVIEMEVEYVIDRGQPIDRTYLTELIGKWVTVNYGNLQYDTTVSQKNPSGSKWKITNIDFPISDDFQENLVQTLGSYTISYTRVEDADYSFFLDSEENADLKDALANGYLKYVESVGDNFDFNRSSDGTFEYNHSVDIKFTDIENIPGALTSEYPLQLSRDFAKVILENTLSHTFQGDLGSLYSGPLAAYINTNTKKYFTESYNLVNKECSFSKRFSTNANVVSNNYQYKLEHSVEQNEAGIFTLTETGTVKGIKKTEEFEQVKIGIDAMVAGAFNRCNTIFGAYISKIDSSAYASLNNVAITLSKDFVNQSHEGTYSISFSNDIKNSSSGVTIERTISIDRDISGFINAKINGSVSKMKDTNDVDWGKNTGTYGSSNAISLKANNSGSTDDLNRIYDAVRRYYVSNGLGVSLLPAASDWVLLKHNYSFRNVGKSISFSFEYSVNNPALTGSGNVEYAGHATNGRDTGGKIRKLEKNINDTLPKPMYNTYPILGWKELVHDANQTELGNRSVTVKAQRMRKAGENILRNPIWPQSIINSLFQVAKMECLKIYSDIPQKYQPFYGSHFITSASSSFDSKGSVSVTCEMSYISKRRAQKGNISTDFREDF